MSYPAYSYIQPATLTVALRVARELHTAAVDIGEMTVGEASGTAMGLFGRAGDRAVAVQEWIGPHRDTFDQLMDNEFTSAKTARRRLEDEADDWAQFWARATNARNQRLHDQAMQRYTAGMADYQQEIEEIAEMLEQDPTVDRYLTRPKRPISPARPPFVPVPMAATDYAPTG